MDCPISILPLAAHMHKKQKFHKSTGPRVDTSTRPHLCRKKKVGSAMRTYVDVHFVLIMNESMSQCTVSVKYEMTVTRNSKPQGLNSRNVKKSCF